MSKGKANVTRPLVGAACVLGLLAHSVRAPADVGGPISADKKLIGFAVNTVEPAYLREHVADIERLPLDG